MRNHSKIQRLKLVLFIWLILLSTLFFSTVLVFGAYQTDTQGGMYTVEYIPVDEIAYTASAINTKLKNTSNLKSITFDYDDGVTYENIKANGTPYVGFPADTNGENISSYIVDNGTTKDVYFLCEDDIIAPTDCTRMFANLTTVTSIELTNFSTASTTSVQYMFYQCSGLLDVTLGNGITSIGNFAFSGCTGLTNIIIGNGVTSIGTYPFSGCKNLINVTIDTMSVLSAIESLGETNGALYLTIGNSVTTIGYDAFFQWKGLISIVIPKSVTSIGSLLFRFCDKLTTISVESGNTKYHSAGNCIIETDSKTLIAGCKNSVIPSDASVVTSIGEFAFNACSALTNIVIPANITNIGSAAFKNCYSVTSISVSTGNLKYHSTGNCLIETDRKTLIVGCKTSVIPTGGSVTKIGYEAFSMSSITNIVIPNTITSIGSYAFADCNKLTSIEIPDSVITIDGSAFRDCNELTSVTIGSGVTSISPFAFISCDSLTSVTFENTSGWFVADSSSATSGTSVDVTSANTNLIAWLTSTSGYYNKYWLRS